MGHITSRSRGTWTSSNGLRRKQRNPSDREVVYRLQASAVNGFLSELLDNPVCHRVLENACFKR